MRRSWSGWSWAALCGLSLLACGDDAPPLGLALGDSTSAAGDDQAAIVDGPDDGGGEASDHGVGVASSTDDGNADVDGDSTDGDGGSTTSGEDGSSSGGESSTGDVVLPTPVLQFVDVAEEAGIRVSHGMFMSSPNCLVDQAGPGTGGFCISERMTGAVAVGDFDDDEWPDLFVPRLHYPDRLYRNNGDGTFSDVAAAWGLPAGVGSGAAAWGDFDNDGDQDLYVTRLGDTRYYLYMNDGGHLNEEAIARGASIKSDIPHSPTGVAVGDYDLDGWLDLYVGEWKTDLGVSKEASHARLLRNRGAAAPGHFEDVTELAGVNLDEVDSIVGAQAGVYAFAPNFSDLDGDDWPDLTVVSDFDCSRLFWNDGDGTFTDGTLAAGAGKDKNGMGSAMIDWDRDGDLDWYVTSITQPTGQPENRFYLNQGNRVFAEIANTLGVGPGGWGWGTTFFDADNDSDYELVWTGGYYYTSYISDKTQLWMTQEDGSFSADVAIDVGVALPNNDSQGRGLVAVDYDRDGDEDLLLINNADFPNLYRNDTTDAGDWLVVRAVGTTSNRDGIGAKIRVITKPGDPILYREVGTSSHYLGQQSRDVHFGVGFGDDPITEVRVYFPVTQTLHILTDVDRNQRIVVSE